MLAALAGAAGYVLHAVERQRAVAAERQALPTRPMADVPAHRPALMFRSLAADAGHGSVAWLALDDAADRRVSSLPCDRVYYAAGHGLCLEARRGSFTSYHAHLFDAGFVPRHTLPLAGPPSRARVSPDGRHAAMTVFVNGHGYDTVSFTTRTSILDTASGRYVVEDLEQLPVWDGERRLQARDFNFWGVTFTRDGRYYATLGTGRERLLVEGRLGEARLQVRHRGVECPSVSPDGRRIAFKRRVAGADGRSGWRVHVLDLESGTDRLIEAETRFIDDQIEWLDDATLAYAVMDGAAGGSDVWSLAVDDRTPPRLLARSAYSPVALR